MSAVLAFPSHFSYGQSRSRGRFRPLKKTEAAGNAAMVLLRYAEDLLMDLKRKNLQPDKSFYGERITKLETPVKFEPPPPPPPPTPAPGAKKGAIKGGMAAAFCKAKEFTFTTFVIYNVAGRPAFSMGGVIPKDKKYNDYDYDY